jgi:hypothetical protein
MGSIFRLGESSFQLSGLVHRSPRRSLAPVLFGSRFQRGCHNFQLSLASGSDQNASRSEPACGLRRLGWCGPETSASRGDYTVRTFSARAKARDLALRGWAPQAPLCATQKRPLRESLVTGWPRRMFRAKRGNQPGSVSVFASRARSGLSRTRSTTLEQCITSVNVAAHPSFLFHAIKNSSLLQRLFTEEGR